MRIFKADAICELADVTAKLIGDNALEQNLIFCEDKFTLELELAIAKEHGGSFGTQVFSFNRFMRKNMDDDKKVLSKEGCTLLVKRIILENKTKLLCFKKSDEPNLPTAVYELIAQLKSAKITYQMLDEVKDNFKGILKNKLYDVSLIYGIYEQFLLNNQLTDGNNRLSNLPKIIDGNDNVKNSHVIVVGFSSLNKQLCHIFNSLIKNAKSIDFVLASGKNGNVYTNELLDFLMQNHKGNLYDYNHDKTRFKLLSNIFDPICLNKFGGYNNNIRLFNCDNVYEEVEYVARIIKSKVFNGELYKNFCLGISDYDSYELTIKRVFSDYEIPAFFDSKVNLSKHPLTRLVCDYLTVIYKNYDIASVINLAKNLLFTPEKNLSDGFENYLLKYSITRKTIKQPFTFEDANLDKYEQIRRAIVSLTAYYDKNVPFKKAIENIIYFIKKLDCENKCKLFNQDLQACGQSSLCVYNEQAYDKFMEVLNQASNILGDNVLSVNEIISVIKSGMASCEISIIPEYNDCVYVGDLRSVKYKQNDYLFLLGINDGVPSSKFDTSILNDRDINQLDNFNVFLQPKIKQVNMRERENVCMALACFKKQLYVSYSSKNLAGEVCTPSPIIKYLIDIFSDQDRKIYLLNKKIVDDVYKQIGDNRYIDYLSMGYATKRVASMKFAGEVSNFKDGLSKDFIAPSTYYSIVKENGESHVFDNMLNDANSEGILQDENLDFIKDSASATVIEGHFGCPYKNFVNCGLKLKERQLSNIAVNDIGILIHAVAEQFAKQLDAISDENQAKSVAVNIIESVVKMPEYVRYLQSEYGKVSFNFIKNECIKFCLDVYNGCKNSQFKPKYFEISFGKDSNHQIKLKGKNGDFYVTGKIDRVDTYQDKMRIIDYKTGYADNKKINELLYSGNKLQLFLYATALNDKYQPVGVYYFKIKDAFTKMDESSIMQMQGKTTDNLEIASKLDNTLTNDGGKAQYIDANFKRKKDGSFVKNDTIISNDTFKDYMEYSKSVAQKGIDEIKRGMITPSPYENECEKCKYHAMCGYDEQLDCKTRTIKNISNQTISSALAQENCENDEKSKIKS